MENSNNNPTYSHEPDRYEFLRVFIASPSDVQEERKIVFSTVSEIKNHCSRTISAGDIYNHQQRSTVECSVRT